jgi:hypothetical protein
MMVEVHLRSLDLNGDASSGQRKGEQAFAEQKIPGLGTGISEATKGTRDEKSHYSHH